MFRIPFVAFAILACASVLTAADPGPSGPIFRRQSSAPAKPAAPPAAVEKLDVPKPFSPPAEALAQGSTVEAAGGAQVDTSEVLRRGDHVTRAGRGPMGAQDRLIGDAMSPPEDDSHKWFVSIVVEKGAKESEALLYDLKHSPDLRAWANPEEQKDSWSHVTIYVRGDESQDFRWKNLRIERYPVMILQPPAKLADESVRDSWIWGDPKTVVWQWDGYDATAPDRAKLRADALRKVLIAYAQKTAQSRERYASTPGPRGKVDRPTPGMKQAAKPSDNTGAPVFPQTISFPGANPVAADPTVPSGSGSLPTGFLDLVGAVLKYFFGQQSWGAWGAALVGLKVFELVAARTKNKLDDKIVEFFRGVVDQAQTSQTKPTT